MCLPKIVGFIDLSTVHAPINRKSIVYEAKCSVCNEYKSVKEFEIYSNVCDSCAGVNVVDSKHSMKCAYCDCTYMDTINSHICPECEEELLEAQTILHEWDKDEEWERRAAEYWEEQKAQEEEWDRNSVMFD